ncbi:BTB/POZ protein [Fusarium oxysporum f. sp. albedinis]|nr:BTB/POZ protein [Fusarium oxysporum f. sp. albedinis]
MAPQGVEGFLSSLKEYYNTDALSDVTVTCDGQVFKAHRIILSAHSKCFAKALSGNWKESSDGNIDIKDFDPGVVDAMLRFIYSFEYDNTQGTPPMIFDACMYQIADKYDIAALKTESKNKFELAIANGWATDDFPVAANLVYVSTPSEDRGLRDIVVDTAGKNIDQLVGKDGFCELTRETPDFAADLIPFLCGKGSESGSVQKYICQSCGRIIQGEFSAQIQYCPYCSYRIPKSHKYQSRFGGMDSP